MAEKNLPKFRKLLKTAMDGYDGTQADFAKEANIAPETLNRMLNQETISKPSKNTLRKLAGIARNGVTYEMLLEACEYAPEKRDNRTAKEKANSFIAFGEYFTEHTAKYSMSPFPSIKDFIESAIMIYSDIDIVYEILDEVPIHAGSERYGDHAVIVKLSSKLSDNISAMTDLLVLYHTTINGKCIITLATNDVNETIKYDSETAKRIIKVKNRATNTATEQTPSNVLYIKNQKKRKYEPITQEERLLKAIFGESSDPDNTVTIAGIGFYIPKNIPEFLIKEFLKNHKDTFCQTEKEADLYNRYINENATKEAVFARYSVDTVTGAGGNCWLGMLVNIIYRETKLNVQGWLNAFNDDDEPIADAIVFANGMPWDFTEDEKYYNRRSLIVALDKYARELRTEIIDCEFEATVK